MPHHFLQYTSWEALRRGGAPDNPAYFYAASSQFDRVGLAPGDVLWYVSFCPAAEAEPLVGKLVLCGRLVVGDITRDEEEVRRRTHGYVWPASTHAFAWPGTERPYTEIDIQDLASHLRFEGPNDRLALHHGRINPQQLQSLRRLTAESVILMERRWQAHWSATAL